MEVGGQICAHAVSSQGKGPWYPRGKRIGGHKSQYGHYGEEKSVFALLEIEPQFLSHPIHSLVSKPNELSWFLENKGHKTLYNMKMQKTT
jgi:hypothetical protein